MPLPYKLNDLGGKSINRSEFLTLYRENASLTLDNPTDVCPRSNARQVIDGKHLEISQNSNSNLDTPEHKSGSTRDKSTLPPSSHAHDDIKQNNYNQSNNNNASEPSGSTNSSSSSPASGKKVKKKRRKGSTADTGSPQLGQSAGLISREQESPSRPNYKEAEADLT